MLYYTRNDSGPTDLNKVPGRLERLADPNKEPRAAARRVRRSGRVHLRVCPGSGLPLLGMCAAVLSQAEDHVGGGEEVALHHLFQLPRLTKLAQPTGERNTSLSQILKRGTHHEKSTFAQMLLVLKSHAQKRSAEYWYRIYIKTDNMRKMLFLFKPEHKNMFLNKPKINTSMTLEMSMICPLK